MKVSSILLALGRQNKHCLRSLQVPPNRGKRPTGRDCPSPKFATGGSLPPHNGSTPQRFNELTGSVPPSTVHRPPSTAFRLPSSVLYLQPLCEQPSGRDYVTLIRNQSLGPTPQRVNELKGSDPPTSQFRSTRSSRSSTANALPASALAACA